MSELSEKIFSLRNKGYSYNQISAELSCSKGTVSYHLGNGQKNKTAERQRKRLSSTSGKLDNKITRFSGPSIQPNYDYGSVNDKRTPSRLRSDKVGDFQKDMATKRRHAKSFGWSDVIGKFGTDPVCYLTGDSLDYDKPREYEFDHIVPRSSGGTNEIDNLGLATKNANRAKGKLSLVEFVDLCEKVARYHGRI